MPKIGLDKLRNIIREELVRSLAEGEQAKSGIDHAREAVKCLDAIEKYKSLATSKALAEMQTELEKVEKVLHRITASPLEYADAVPEEAPSGDLEVLDSSGPDAKKSVRPNIVKTQAEKKQ